MKGENRIGFVSSYNPVTGMAAIYYPDRNDEVTEELPILAISGIQQTLQKEDAVIVAHLSNGSGVILGPYSSIVGALAAGISASGGSLVFKDASGSITLKQIIEKCR